MKTEERVRLSRSQQLARLSAHQGYCCDQLSLYPHGCNVIAVILLLDTVSASNCDGALTSPSPPSRPSILLVTFPLSSPCSHEVMSSAGSNGGDYGTECSLTSETKHCYPDEAPYFPQDVANTTWMSNTIKYELHVLHQELQKEFGSQLASKLSREFGRCLWSCNQFCLTENRMR